jgi:hypothetical protein
MSVCLAYFPTLKTEATCSSETSFYFQCTGQHYLHRDLRQHVLCLNIQQHYSMRLMSDNFLWPFELTFFYISLYLANLPPTLSKSQVSSVRKHLKMQLLNLLKHPSSVDFHNNITTLLTDLGATYQEVCSLYVFPVHLCVDMCACTGVCE